MAKGKYAARAANHRAAESQATAAELRDLLASERLERERIQVEVASRYRSAQGLTEGGGN